MSASRPSAHSYQSDVETVHRLIADEFFDWESFSSRADFLAKASLYQLYFNLARPNSHKEGRAPWQIIQQLDPRFTSISACFLLCSWTTVSTHTGGTMYLDIPAHTGYFFGALF